MKPAQKTWALAALAAVLLALNLVDPGEQARAVAALPTLAAVSKDEIRRVEVSNAVEKIVLEAIREEGASGEAEPVWHLRAPITGDADQAAVRALLLGFRKELPLDVKVDEASGEKLAEYGLDAGSAIVVELFGAGEEPKLSFILGKDAPGGSSFVRLPGSDAVYRARVGGRHRFERPPAAWRNRVLLGFPVEDARSLRISRAGAEPYSLTRVDGGPWALSPAADFPVDQDAVEGALKALSGLKAGELLDPSVDGGFSPPAATAEVVLADGRTLKLELGAAATEGAAIVRAGAVVGRVAAGPVARLRAAPGDWRDLRLLAFAREEVDTLRLAMGGEEVILQQDLASGLWRAIQPANVDIDVKLVFFAINTMAELKGERLVEGDPAALGLSPPRFTVTARLIGGAEQTLRVGAARRDPEGKVVYPVSGRGPELMELREATVQKLLAAFGRGDLARAP